MSSEYEMQQQEQPGEKSDMEKRKREREEWEKRVREGSALAAAAQEYGQKITEAASQAKEYITDKVSVVGDKFKDLQNADLAEIAENARDYARKSPGKTILISATAGLIVGLLIGRRRS